MFLKEAQGWKAAVLSTRKKGEVSACSKEVEEEEKKALEGRVHIR